jgi:hypothetical protein
MREVSLRGCLHWAFLLVLLKPNLLQPLIDIEPEVPLFIIMLGPSRYEYFLRVLCLGCDLYDRLPEELDHVILERLFAWISCSDRDEAFDQRLQVSRLRAPYVRRLALHLVHRVICAQSSVGKRTVPDTDGFKEGSGGRCRKSGLAYRRADVWLIREAVASEANYVLCVAVGSANETGLVRDISLVGHLLTFCIRAQYHLSVQCHH